MTKKKKYSVGYFSSYDRGLECLLDMWPKVVEQVPKATLDIAYGWDMFDQFYANDPEKQQWKFTMIQKLNQPGVSEHGRLSHEDLAKLMKSIQVWAYPTEFTEIHCITALKAQEAGCIPVVNVMGALDETVKSGIKLYGYPNIYTDQSAQNHFIERLVGALNGDKGLTNKVPKRYWSDVAKVWSAALC